MIIHCKWVGCTTWSIGCTKSWPIPIVSDRKKKLDFFSRKSAHLASSQPSLKIINDFVGWSTSSSASSGSMLQAHPTTSKSWGLRTQNMRQCTWLDSPCIVCFGLQPIEKRTTADIYWQQLHWISNPLTQELPRYFSVWILYENARPHSVRVTRKKIYCLCWKEPHHNPYRPDCGSDDYHPSPTSPLPCRGRHSMMRTIWIICSLLYMNQSKRLSRRTETMIYL